MGKTGKAFISVNCFMYSQTTLITGNITPHTYMSEITSTELINIE